MSFEIFYAGEVRSQQIFYSTPKEYISPIGKYEKFVQKMDAIAKEIKTLETEEENSLVIEEKQEEMVALVQKEFTQKGLDECYESGEENYFIHDSSGRLEVDDEEISIKDFFGDEYEKWEKERDERLRKLDWYLLYDVLDSGVHYSEEGLELEGEFDKKKLTMKNNCLHYDDEPIIDPDGTDRSGSVLELYVSGECVSEVEPVWYGEEEEEEEENIVPYREGFIYTDEKKYCFMKRTAADVEIKDESGSTFFTFTPWFGEFRMRKKDLEYYLVNYVKEKKLDWCNVEIEWLRHCHYEMNLETKELGEFLESSGIESVSWEWNPKTQEFDDVPDEEEEEEEE
jgi:hypothetical protein